MLINDPLGRADAALEAEDVGAARSMFAEIKIGPGRHPAWPSRG